MPDPTPDPPAFPNLEIPDDRSRPAQAEPLITSGAIELPPRATEGGVTPTAEDHDGVRPSLEPIPESARPKYKLFSPGDVAWATFWGGPLGGFVALGLNYLRLGQRLGAFVCLLAGLLVTATLVWAATLIPDHAIFFLPGVLALAVLWGLARWLHGAAFVQHRLQGGEKVSPGVPFGLGLLCSFLVFVGILAAGQAYEGFIRSTWGTPVKFGKDEEIFYTSDMTEADARQLGRYFQNSGFFDGKSPKGVRLWKSRRGVGVDFVVHKWVLTDKAELANFREYAEHMAGQAFPGKEVTVRLCDEQFEVLLAFEPFPPRNAP